MIARLRMRYHAWRAAVAWAKRDNEPYWHHTLKFHRVKRAAGL